MNPSNYQDRYLMWHNKKCFDGHPSSSKPATYTAYAQLMGFHLDRDVIVDYYKGHTMISDDRFILVKSRLSDNKENYFSEIVGWVSLGILNASFLEKYKWRFCDHFYSHRIYSIPKHIKYYIKKVGSYEVSVIEYLMFVINVISVIFAGSPSRKNLAYLMLTNLDSKWLVKLMRPRKNFASELGDYHPLLIRN